MGFLDVPNRGGSGAQIVPDPADADVLLITSPSGSVVVDPSDADALLITT
jgi:hypothetical protein